MDFRKIFEQIHKLVSENQLDEAETLVKKLIKTEPSNAIANYFLGVILEKKNLSNKAIKYYELAVVSKPDFFEAIYNIAVYQKKNKMFQKAEKNFKKCIKLKSDFAEAYNNLGIVLYELKKYEESIIHYNFAIKLKPNLIEVYNNIANSYKKNNKFSEAEIYYKKALDLKPDFNGANFNLAKLFFDLGKINDAELYFKKCIELEPKNSDFLLNFSIFQDFLNNYHLANEILLNILKIDNNDKFKAYVNLAIYKFLENHVSECQKFLKNSLQINIIKSEEFKNFKIYHNFLSKLILQRKEKLYPERTKKHYDKIFVIGDSHSLVYHDLIINNLNKELICESKLIFGCKQWHLANSEENKYKYKFINIFNSLPKASYVVLSIGEIDCRINEGIYDYSNRNSLDHCKIADFTIKNYLDYIKKINIKNNHKIIIQGIPCPNIDITKIENQKFLKYLDFVKYFNKSLENNSINLKFNFLNLYDLTNRGDGYSNQIWHLDNYHLKPDIKKKTLSEIKL